MIRSRFFGPDNLLSEINIEQIAGLLRTKKGLLWINLEKPTPGELTSVLQDIFRFHPLAIEDCQSQGFQTAKVDDHRDYLFIITHALKNGNDIEELSTDELNIFLGPNYVVTSHHADSMHPIENVWQRCEVDDRIYMNGADFLCHAILDVVVDDYLPFIDKMDEEIDWLEDKVLEKPNP